MPTPSWNSSLRVSEPERSGGLIVSAALRRDRQRVPKTGGGVMCSKIVDDIIQTMYPKKRVRPFAEQTLVAYREFGNALEWMIADGLKAREKGWVKPPSRRVGGIWVRPDGWNERTRLVDEIKATWVSMRDFFDSPKCHGYLMQALMGAHAFDAEGVRLTVLFVNGDYKPPVPDARTFYWTWVKPDVPLKTYRMLRVHAQDRGWLK